MLKQIEEILISPTASISEAMQLLDRTAEQVILLIDDNHKLIGTITDGDIRRAILSGLPLGASVEKVANKSPLVFEKEQKFNIVEARKRNIAKVPIVNREKEVVGLYDIYSDQSQDEKENVVVLMAGGLGTRLRPLTDKKPKPLLEIGDKPILQIIIENFSKYGFKKFYLSVNYKSDMIKSFFQDGQHLGVTINYLEEKERLGTAGALSLLDAEQIKAPFFVMNGDLLTNVDFQKMLCFQKEQDAIATVGVREYDFQVPYGVIETKNGYITSVEEKPTHSFFVSAGVYLLKPESLKNIPKDTFYDMPTLIEDLINQNQKIGSFPIHEYWLDIGRMEEYEKANEEYKEDELF